MTTEPEIGFELVDGRDAMAMVIIQTNPDNPDQLELSVRSSLGREDLVTVLRYATDAIEQNGVKQDPSAPGAGLIPRQPGA